MISAAVLVGLLLITTATDIRWGMIYNWTTYPAIVLALFASGLATWLGVDEVNGTEMARVWIGIPQLWQALLGFFACAALMLVCYVFFAGTIGGGDIKLIAMIGAFMGLFPGLEALLWTFIVGGAFALIRLVWRYGLLKLFGRAAKYVLAFLKLGTMTALTEDDRKPLQVSLYLSPCALVAVIIVKFQLIDWF